MLLKELYAIFHQKKELYAIYLVSIFSNDMVQMPNPFIGTVGRKCAEIPDQIWSESSKCLITDQEIRIQLSQ